jgi:hypothetical protein
MSINGDTITTTTTQIPIFTIKCFMELKCLHSTFKSFIASISRSSFLSRFLSSAIYEFIWIYGEIEEEWEEDDKIKKKLSFWSLAISSATCAIDAPSKCHMFPKKCHIGFFVKLTANFNVWTKMTNGM